MYVDIGIDRYRYTRHLSFPIFYFDSLYLNTYVSDCLYPKAVYLVYLHTK